LLSVFTARVFDMKAYEYRFKFNGITDTERITDLFHLSCIAAKAVLGVDQAELETVVSRGKRRVPVAINAAGRIGGVLAKVFMAYANEVLQPNEFEVVRQLMGKGDA
jgi:hypothetical protein